LKISREVKTAVLVLSGIALFIYLFSYLKGEDLFQSKNFYYTEFDYNALSMSSPVTVKGNRVGKIEDIAYMYDTGKTRVTFSVNPKLKFSKNSIAKLYEAGIMGGNGLTIIDTKTGEQAVSGDFLQSQVEPGLIASLQNNFSNISTDLDKTIRSADTLMTSLNAIVADDTDQGLKSTIAELNSTLKSFKSLSYSIQGVIKENDTKISLLLDNFSKSSNDLNALTSQLKDLDIKTTKENFDKTLTSLQNIFAMLDNNEGTIGKLLNDDALYNNLEAASKELELLLLDVKLHPARYRRILSKKEIPYKKPTPDQMN